MTIAAPTTTRMASIYRSSGISTGRRSVIFRTVEEEQFAMYLANVIDVAFAYVFVLVVHEIRLAWRARRARRRS
jgi:hypothetical protein